ncbi:hypothetical protein RI030_07305 [Aphanizomenon flos-aquae NRERC-008]|uniref:Uncharacterized protein n=1 Tax=Aphanizomenon flos-aquae FACHB-1249 TaxID=2692889 RepID=A0ABR8IVL5_APHFL|nr:MULTISPECIES: hypothetical protein [Aphanizomenon]MBD2686243.1 hypothetical protein [Aphanizomenon flos-aquae FACHB-1249]MBD2391884.1 hypothetical protein [Aphanizomenon flos-aquae FACHB-1171]MBD2558888.1 hypothetical protein [Aphanizomenon flos-aquae FACHB-1290]MBD2633231.1 hypothetical protein [Aphanizomenon sp. FACHB-1399]MBD2643701.1 hypothetical protein [Aphanizomenon sp. FACHB-1401]
MIDHNDIYLWEIQAAAISDIFPAHRCLNSCDFTWGVKSYFSTVKAIPAGCFAIAFGTEFRTIAPLHHYLTKSDRFDKLC